MSIRVIIAPRYWICKGPSRSGDKGGWLMVPRDGRWTFNGDMERPTFSPSVNESWTNHKGEERRNHYIITDGRVQFCGDCTHENAGQTHDLLEWTEAEIAMHSEDRP